MAQAPGGEVLVYEAPDGSVRVDVRLDRETVWLSQEQMAELFGRERSVVTKHIRNVFKEGELDPGAVCAKFAHDRLGQACPVPQPRGNRLGRLPVHPSQVLAFVNGLPIVEDVAPAWLESLAYAVLHYTVER